MGGLKEQTTMMAYQGNGHSGDLDHLDVDTQIERVDTKAVAVLNRSEVEAQLDAAHKYPRQIKRFLNEAITLATLTRDVAESCIYALPRGGKTIAGPSVRLAEICASAYGNFISAPASSTPRTRRSSPRAWRGTSRRTCA
jgi:hypothetical protein